MAKQLLKLHARYNVWAYQQLLQSVSKLTTEQYHANAGLCFRSVHGTINHLLAADRLWLTRLEGKTDSEAYQLLSSFWGHPSAEMYSTAESTSCYWEQYVTDREALAEAVLAQANQFALFVETLTEDASEEFSYDKRGVIVSKKLDRTLLHIVNHATHHRGQVSAAISSFGLAPPVMDLFYFEG
ncbi:DNA damage-inducible protein DinB [Chytriomyces cf. hyalinus JEL632]|nr:DNA damage-inducible protein DinB [Chytriomyces cf. hyalinus JEL632]